MPGRVVESVVFVTLIHLLVSAYRWFPGPLVAHAVAPRPELVVFLAITFAASFASNPVRKAARWFTALSLAALAFFSVGEAFYQSVYREGFVPVSDLAYFPALLNMVLETELFAWTVSMTVLYCIVGAAVVLPVVVGLRRLTEVFRRYRRGGSIVLGLLAVVALAGAMRDASPPLSVRLVSSFSIAQPEETTELTREYASVGLGRSDLHLIIVESYGRVLYRRDELRSAIEPRLRATESALEEAGFVAYSSFLESPAFGGRSWLADATLLTGLWIDSQAKYDGLLQSKPRNLTHILGDAGFARVFAAPGTYSAGDDWRAVYRYDHYLFRGDFGYEGPVIGFGELPDQYLLHATRRFAGSLLPPVFFTYVLVSSHVPFDRIPPYLTDWDQLGDGSVYRRLPNTEFDSSWVAGSQHSAGYVAAMDYVLRTVSDYITEQVDDESLFIVVGDHQPRSPVTTAADGFAVPVHIVSKDSDHLSRLREFGFRVGFVPDQAPPHPSMDEFPRMVLSVLEGRADESPAYDVSRRKTTKR